MKVPEDANASASEDPSKVWDGRFLITTVFLPSLYK